MREVERITLISSYQLNHQIMKLVICEKQIAAKRIANILSKGKFKRNSIGKIPFYSFKRDNEEWAVVGLKGHIITIDFPKELNRWRSVPLEKLVWSQPVKIVSNKEIEKVLKSFSKHDLDIIVATDFDREGELIGLETVELLKKYGKNIKSIKRARFSTLTKDEIEKAFSNLVDIDYNLARSAEARQIIDLVWGATLTRFISLSANRHGKDFLSIGRVQSPTLAMIVEREREIRDFVPKPYWQILAILKKGEEFFAVHSKGNIFDEDIAKRIYERVKGEKVAIVREYSERRKKESPPPPFDTTSFLAAASNFLKISAPKAMEIAENLYMNGWISYPRTDNTVYPKSIPMSKILNNLSKAYPDEVNFVKSRMRNVPSGGKKRSTDHPPIHPVDVPPIDKLSKDQKRIYDLVVRRFLATLTEDSVVEFRRGILEINGEKFVAEGKVTIEKNWKEIYPVREDERKIPKLENGENVEIVTIKLVRKETKPPKRFTQGTLISEMEKLGLGTKSTRHEIIKKLYSRKYVVGSNLIPTESAFAVIDTIKPYDISKPDMTAHLEKEMDKIAEGSKNRDEVIKESREMLSKVLESLRKEEDNIKKSLKTAIRTQSRIGRCPKCGRDLVIRYSSSRKRFVGCTGYPNCKVTYPLPQKGRIERTNKTCKCGAPIVKINGREICLDPNCER